MTAPFDLPSSCDIYRPFGALSPRQTGVECRVVPTTSIHVRNDYLGTGPNIIYYTHWIDFQPDIDVRDGCGRSLGSNNTNYADGDEIRVQLEGFVHQFVVVWVEERYPDEEIAWRRALCIRQTRAKV